MMGNNKRNILLATLVMLGVVIGIGITTLFKFTSSEAIPNNYEPTLTQEGEKASQEHQIEAQSNVGENLSITPFDERELAQQNTQDNANKHNEAFAKQNRLARFSAFPAQVYRGEWISMGDECVNCEGGPQSALKKQQIDFAGSYVLYTLPQGDNQTIVGALNVENGEVVEFPAVYKEVGAPFDLRTFSQANSNLVWIQGIDANNLDIYRIDAFVLKNGEIERVQGFEISFLSQILAPQSLDNLSDDVSF